MEKITIDGVEYSTEAFSDEQKFLTNQCLDIESQLAALTFKAQQLEAAKGVFIFKLKESLTNETK